jgi:Domain of unknown function (DUF4417)
VTARLPREPARFLFSFAESCPDPCHCGYRGTEAECPPNPHPETLSGASDDIGSALAEVRALELDTTVLRPQARIALPPVLLQVDGSKACRGVHRPTVAIAFGQLIAKIGLRARKRRRLTDILHLPQGTRVGVLLFANDPLLEGLWRNRREWATRLAQLEPAFVVAPDFSLWAGDHALGTRYNLVRSVRFIELLQDRGLATIPHFYWSTPRDIGDIAAWIDANRPEAVAIDMQCMPTPTEAFLAELAWLREQLPKPPTLLVAGIDAGPRLKKLVAIWPELSMTRNFVPEVAKHVELRERGDGTWVRERSDDAPSILLERRLERAEFLMVG